jgi:phosphate transport system protein
MPLILQKEIDRLKQMLIDLATIVEENVYNSVKSISDKDLQLADRVIRSDPEVDQMEVDIEEECLKILALHQPVAIDLRYIVTVLKMNNDLERIGDLATNIAERAQFLCLHMDITGMFDFAVMSDKVQAMLKKSLDALINMDSGLAREVIQLDDEIDDMNRATFKKVEAEIMQRPEDCGCLIRLLSVSRYLERIADHTTNIAEDVIYLKDGQIVRHAGGQF